MLVTAYDSGHIPLAGFILVHTRSRIRSILRPFWVDAKNHAWKRRAATVVGKVLLAPVQALPENAACVKQSGVLKDLPFLKDKLINFLGCALAYQTIRMSIIFVFS